MQRNLTLPICIETNFRLRFLKDNYYDLVIKFFVIVMIISSNFYVLQEYTIINLTI